MRIFLLLTTTIAVMLGSIILIVALAMHRLKAADQAADQAWAARPQMPSTIPSDPATAPTPTTIPSPPMVPAIVVHPEPVVLLVLDGKTAGPQIWSGGGITENWKEFNSSIEWTVNCAAGQYSLQFIYALRNRSNSITVEIGGKTLNYTITPTGEWGHFGKIDLGLVTLNGRETVLRIKPGPGAALDDGLMRLRSVALVPPGMTVADPMTASLSLTAANCELHGDRIKRSDEADPKIVNWISPADWPDWSAKLPAQQDYRMELTLSNADSTGGDFEVMINQVAIHCHAGSTGGFDTPKTVPLGTTSIPSGRVTFQIKPVGEFHNALMNFWKLTFVPTGGAVTSVIMTCPLLLRKILIHPAHGFAQ